jgi:hypothetical protein
MQFSQEIKTQLLNSALWMIAFYWKYLRKVLTPKNDEDEDENEPGGENRG